MDTRMAQIAEVLQEFTYDHDGNLTSDGLLDYQWDADGARQRGDGQTAGLPAGLGSRVPATGGEPRQNRLIRMETSSNAQTYNFPHRVIEFRYDYMGRRVQKRVIDADADPAVDISYRRFLYDGWNLVAEFNLEPGTSNLSLVRSYTWGLDIVNTMASAGGVGALLQIADHATGRTFLPSYDGNGNVAALFNADTGEVAAAYEYSPYGEPLRAQSFDPVVADNPFRFSTKFTDVETGLVYYGHRYYEPRNGRFINRDPIEEAGGLNLYGLVGNNPVNRWDYLGLSQFEIRGWDDGNGYYYGALWAMDDMDEGWYDTGDFFDTDGSGNITREYAEERVAGGFMDGGPRHGGYFNGMPMSSGDLEFTIGLASLAEWASATESSAASATENKTQEDVLDEINGYFEGAGIGEKISANTQSAVNAANAGVIQSGAVARTLEISINTSSTISFFQSTTGTQTIGAVPSNTTVPPAVNQTAAPASAVARATEAPTVAPNSGVALHGAANIDGTGMAAGGEAIQMAPYEVRPTGLDNLKTVLWDGFVEPFNFNAHPVQATINTLAVVGMVFGARGPTLSNQAIRGIRSLERQIAQHEAKLAEFIKNPTVRPGMEGQPRAVIEAAQQARVRHLQREIDAFKGNIEKLKKGGG